MQYLTLNGGDIYTVKKINSGKLTYNRYTAQNKRSLRKRMEPEEREFNLFVPADVICELICKDFSIIYIKPSLRGAEVN